MDLQVQKPVAKLSNEARAFALDAEIRGLLQNYLSKFKKPYPNQPGPVVPVKEEGHKDIDYNTFLGYQQRSLNYLTELKDALRQPAPKEKRQSVFS